MSEIKHDDKMVKDESISSALKTIWFYFKEFSFIFFIRTSKDHIHFHMDRTERNTNVENNKIQHNKIKLELSLVQMS